MSKKYINNVALLLQHATITAQITAAAPTTMYLDVALETMPLVSLVVIKTPVTLITADRL